MKTKKKIGITGGIGAGKSFVCSIIENLGYPVFYSDSVAKKLTDTHPEIKKQIIELFGHEAYLSHSLNRPFIAQQVFNDKGLLEQLNQIIHPAVQHSFHQFYERSNKSLIFNEAAIIFETGSYKNFDATILVKAPKDLRIKRVLNRDNSTEKEIEKRMDKQWSDQKKEQIADYVILNDDKSLLTPQIIAIIDKLTV
ncbi:dephospho-CoA kinase [Crocinitomix algicola]|uniref:dephospho-CoA kinase n=1 Tax=Crocinitomix algicola TaxID=1740263 RepID=UPI000836C763|nr:dephospho-CoA kinase [Crocinitomix algicola]